MSITATELKNNLGKYLLLSAKEDIFITKNGKIVAKLTNPHQDRVEVAKSLFGILPKDADLNEAKEESIQHGYARINQLLKIDEDSCRYKCDNRCSDFKRAME